MSGWGGSRISHGEAPMAAEPYPYKELKAIEKRLEFLEAFIRYLDPHGYDVAKEGAREI